MFAGQKSLWEIGAVDLTGRWSRFVPADRVDDEPSNFCTAVSNFGILFDLLIFLCGGGGGGF